MKMTNKDYGEYVKKKSPNSPIALNLVKAFIVGGLICCAGQALHGLFENLNMDDKTASAFTSITLVFCGALLTGLGIYDNIAKFGGAGSLVPITGFANSVVSPALEFKSEGFVTGMAAKMFIIAGPVITFGTAASIIYGLIYFIYLHI